MPYALLADLLLILHLGFIVFVVFGGLLVRRWCWLAWLHLPTVVWGVVLEAFGLICPLTPWEKRLRELAGEAGYETGFIEHYILPLLYPADLTREIQWGLAAMVLLVNLLIYLPLLHKRLRRG